MRTLLLKLRILAFPKLVLLLIKPM
ncbi:hypothetical protein Ahy_A03g014832 isoform H [Arachis hypogaea]|uniref:Uncharacterized protein n=1 Tax=Arachis hypogaea TaxID=3818 RepID=A0A445A3W6_ARAHY|nr:hypothetical protein Ahy_B03g066401 isoform H [Arachis hypogaea]RYR68340.1 hypothetical protein Ahy_A03g014832 isoform H [Arachis hypogaea]